VSLLRRRGWDSDRICQEGAPLFPKRESV
jgi:hypothetical protein